MDPTHALFKAHRVPRDVIVDHEPAELKVYTFARCLGCHQNLAGVPKFPLRVYPCVRSVTVADLHSAMYLGHRKMPLTKPSYKKIEGVLVLRKDKELHLGVIEYLLLGKNFFQFDPLALDFP